MDSASFPRSSSPPGLEAVSPQSGDGGHLSPEVRLQVWLASIPPLQSLTSAPRYPRQSEDGLHRVQAGQLLQHLHPQLLQGRDPEAGGATSCGGAATDRLSSPQSAQRGGLSSPSPCDQEEPEAEQQAEPAEEPGGRALPVPLLPQPCSCLPVGCLPVLGHSRLDLEHQRYLLIG